jgi:small subunit ribosomal protein S17
MADEKTESTEEQAPAEPETPDTAAEPEAAAPEVTEPEATEPEAAEPEVAAREAATEPDTDEPRATEVLSPKERRRRGRTVKAAKAPARSSRSAEERHEDRVAERRRKAVARSAGRVRARAKARAAEHGSETTPPREHEPGRQKSRQGVVTSDRADKTITVRIDLARRHRRYEKIVRTSTTLHVHDERNDAHIGDTVVVRECRPLSRTKRWRLIEILERAK